MVGLTGSNPDEREDANPRSGRWRELAQIEDSLLQAASRLDGQLRSRLLIINGHLGLLRSVHEAILAEGPEPSIAEAPQTPQ